MSPSLAERQAWLRAQPGISLSAVKRKVLRDAQEAALEARRAAPKHKPDSYDARYEAAAERRRMEREQRRPRGPRNVKKWEEALNQRLRAMDEDRQALIDEVTE